MNRLARRTAIWTTVAMLLASGWAGGLLASGWAGGLLASGWAGGDEPQPPLPRISDIRDDAAAFIRRSNQAATDPERVAAVIDMCLLHHQIVADPRYDRSSQLQSYRASLARRLNAVAREIERHQSRLQRDMRRTAGSGDDGTRKSGSSADPSGGGFAWSDGMASNSSLSSALTGGPMNAFGFVFGHAAAPPFDYGPALVELIQSTIQPEFWQRNDGPGIIYYYRPLRILVISGTMSVHEDTVRLLHMLRQGR